jgi:hypothetical protein
VHFVVDGPGSACLASQSAGVLVQYPAFLVHQTCDPVAAAAPEAARGRVSAVRLGM